MIPNLPPKNITRELADGGILIYYPAFFAKKEADAHFLSLKKTVAWKQEHGRFNRPFPRLTAFYGDEGVVYTYSGVSYPALPWTEELTVIRRQVEEAAHCPLNSVLLNFYRDSKDSMGFHSDDEPELGTNPVVPSLSVGAVRRFVLRQKKTREKIEYFLAHGSLLIMAGTLQHFWEHALPKTTEPAGERINLTFRWIGVGKQGSSSVGGGQSLT